MSIDLDVPNIHDAHVNDELFEAILMEDRRVYNFTLGPTVFSPWDFSMRATVYVNDKKVGIVDVERLQDERIKRGFARR
jgi:hypothetical protein